jgi:integrase
MEPRLTIPVMAVLAVAGTAIPAQQPTPGEQGSILTSQTSAKTEGGEGRTIPSNSALFAVLMDYVEWYELKYGRIRPDWYVFPFGSPQPADPTRHVTTLKTVWTNIRARAGVKGRWHDNRHTLVTELAESCAGDQTIMDIAGHVSKQSHGLNSAFLSGLCLCVPNLR